MNEQQTNWEILDPQIKTQINNLNENIINLTNENKKLKDDFNNLKKENVILNKNISELNENLKNIKKLNIENNLMFNKIKDFLEIGRTKYLQGFDTIKDSINQFEHKYSIKLEKIEKNINKHTDNVVFDPNYKMRVNNFHWRNKLSNKSNNNSKDYINNPI